MLHLKTKFNLLSFVLVALAGILTFHPADAQNKSSDKDDETMVMVTKEGIEYEVTGWDTRTVYDPNSYTFSSWETPIYETVKTKEVFAVPMSDFDKAPVFTEACVGAEDPVACTNHALEEFTANNPFPYPDRAQENQQEGLEYVSFVLTEDGEFEGTPTILSKDIPCKGCSEEALRIVKETEGKWQPAVLNGERVKVKLTLPIRFKLEETPFR